MSTAAPSKSLHIGLWVVQGLLAFAFLGAGSMKLTQPIDALATNMAWVTHVPELGVRVIGSLEIAGALGLLLPSALRILPKLTAAAAGGLVLTMIGAAITHISIGEAPMVVVPAVLGSLAAFVAWGRGVAAPIAAR